MRFKKDVFKAKLKLNFTIQNPEVSKVIWGLVFAKSFKTRKIYEI